jgi:L-fuconolactonase
MRIDAHQHFWKFDPLRDSWITNDMAVIRRDFLPGDLQPLLQQNGFDGCVAVQADQSEEETRFLVDLAKENAFIKGVVGWVDLQAENSTERLEYFKRHEVVKGFRHILQGEKERDLMLHARFKKGIALLEQFNFTYDILIFPDQLKFARQLVSSFPNQKFIIDHLAKPYIKTKKIEEWKRDILQMTQYENVYCKISGLLTEADWQNWKKEDFIPYLDVAVEAFGSNRMVFGSDWPVSLLAGSYKKVVNVVADYFASFSKAEQDQFFGKNAIQFYNL